jgi:hypothetical protein
MWGRKRGVNLLDTPQMDTFFERLEGLNQAEVQALTAVWHAASKQRHEDAWLAIRAVGAREALSKEIDRIRDRALDEVSRGTNFVPYTVIDLPRQTRIEAGPAIVDAAVAIALGTRLDPATRELLMAPWLRATQANS